MFGSDPNIVHAVDVWLVQNNARRIGGNFWFTIRLEKTDFFLGTTSG